MKYPGYGDWSIVWIQNPGDRDPDFDPDDDGFPNFSEFAFGSRPGSATDVPVFVPSTNGSRLRLAFTRSREDVTYSVMGSSDLVLWQSVATSQGPASNVVVEDTLNFGPGTPRFLRIEAAPVP